MCDRPSLLTFLSGLKLSSIMAKDPTKEKEKKEKKERKEKKEKKRKEAIEEAPAEAPSTDVPEDVKMDTVEDAKALFSR